MRNYFLLLLLLIGFCANAQTTQDSVKTQPLSQFDSIEIAPGVVFPVQFVRNDSSLWAKFSVRALHDYLQAHKLPRSTPFDGQILKYAAGQDSLTWFTPIVDSTRLIQDSILVYYQNSMEIGRDTLIAGSGGSGSGVVDSTRLVQDSILVYYQDGVELGRDTLQAGSGSSGPETDPIYVADSASLADTSYVIEKVNAQTQVFDTTFTSNGSNDISATFFDAKFADYKEVVIDATLQASPSSNLIISLPPAANWPHKRVKISGIDNADPENILLSGIYGNPSYIIESGQTIYIESILFDGAYEWVEVNPVASVGVYNFRTLSDLINTTETLELGDRVKLDDTGAEYLIQSESVAGYVVDSVAVVPVGSNYAVVQQKNSSYNPTHFGAIGDGVANDQQAIQKMFDFGGVTTYNFPKGVFLINSQIVLPDSTFGKDAYLAIVGNGTTLKTNSSITILERNPSNQSDALSLISDYKIKIKGIAFEGDSGIRGQKAIDIGATYGLMIEQNSFLYFDTALVVRFALNPFIEQNRFTASHNIDLVCTYGELWGGTDGNAATNAGEISNNRFFALDTTQTQLYLEGTDDMLIRENIFEGFAPDQSIYLDANNSLVNKNVFRDNYIETASDTTSVEFRINTSGAVIIDGLERDQNHIMFDLSGTVTGTNINIKNIPNWNINPTQKIILDSNPVLNFGVNVDGSYIRNAATYGGTLPTNLSSGNIPSYTTSQSLTLEPDVTAGNNARMRLKSNLMFPDDNTYRIGKRGSNADFERPREIYVGDLGLKTQGGVFFTESSTPYNSLSSISYDEATSFLDFTGRNFNFDLQNESDLQISGSNFNKAIHLKGAVNGITGIKSSYAGAGNSYFEVGRHDGARQDTRWAIGTTNASKDLLFTYYDDGSFPYRDVQMTIEDNTGNVIISNDLDVSGDYLGVTNPLGGTNTIQASLDSLKAATDAASTPIDTTLQHIVDGLDGRIETEVDEFKYFPLVDTDGLLVDPDSLIYVPFDEVSSKVISQVKITGESYNSQQNADLTVSFGDAIGIYNVVSQVTTGSRRNNTITLPDPVLSLRGKEVVFLALDDDATFDVEVTTTGAVVDAISVGATTYTTYTAANGDSITFKCLQDPAGGYKWYAIN